MKDLIIDIIKVYLSNEITNDIVCKENEITILLKNKTKAKLKIN